MENIKTIMTSFKIEKTVTKDQGPRDSGTHPMRLSHLNSNMLTYNFFYRGILITWSIHQSLLNTESVHYEQSLELVSTGLSRTFNG